MLCEVTHQESGALEVLAQRHEVGRCFRIREWLAWQVGAAGASPAQIPAQRLERDRTTPPASIAPPAPLLTPPTRADNTIHTVPATRRPSQWCTRSSFGAGSVSLSPLGAGRATDSLLTTAASSRRCRTTMAARYRNATPLQQGISLGLPHLCGHWWQLWLLAHGRGAPTVQTSGRPPRPAAGEAGTKEGARGGSYQDLVDSIYDEAKACALAGEEPTSLWATPKASPQLFPGWQ